MSNTPAATQPALPTIIEVEPIDGYRIHSPTPSVTSPSELSSTSTAVEPMDDSGPVYLPRTAATAIQITDNFDTVTDIARGLIRTLKQQEREHQEDQEQWSREHNTQGEELEFLRARLVDYCATLPTEECPDGYMLNRDGQCPGFAIPIQDGMWEPAHWVKQLPDGHVAGLPKEHGPDEVPWVQQIYATPYDDGDNDYVVLPMPHWLLELLKGPAVAYATLEKAVGKDGDWGLYSDIRMYRELEHHHADKQLQLNLLQTQLKRIKQSQEAALRRLEMARLEQRVSILRTLQPGHGLCSPGAHGGMPQPRPWRGVYA
jgi:hypothetical protein